MVDVQAVMQGHDKFMTEFAAYQAHADKVSEQLTHSANAIRRGDAKAANEHRLLAEQLKAAAPPLPQ